MKDFIKKQLKKNYNCHVFYIHLPKTGGNTIRQIFQNNYKNTNNLYSGSDIERQIEFKKKCIAQNQNGIFTTGHIYYGYHKFLSEGVPYKYYTMLRNPIDRIISQYNYIITGQSKHWLEEYRNNLTFSEYIHSNIERDLDNMQSRRLAGLDYHFDKVPFGMLDKSTLDLAISNIKNDFFTPGILSNFDKSILTMKKEYKLKHCYYKSKNITNKTMNTIKINDVSTRDLNFLRELNEFDLKLFHYCFELNRQETRNISTNSLYYFNAVNRTISNIF